MAVHVIDTIKPKNNLDFPVVEAVDVAVEGYSNLADAVAHFATDTVLATVTNSLQAQIDQIAQAAGTGTADTEVVQARVDVEGNTHATLKERIDKIENAHRDDMVHAGLYTSRFSTKNSAHSSTNDKIEVNLEAGKFYTFKLTTDNANLPAHANIIFYDSNDTNVWQLSISATGQPKTTKSELIGKYYLGVYTESVSGTSNYIASCSEENGVSVVSDIMLEKFGETDENIEDINNDIENLNLSVEQTDSRQICLSKLYRNTGEGTYWQTDVLPTENMSDFYVKVISTENVTASVPLMVRVRYSNNTNNEYSCNVGDTVHILTNTTSTLAGVDFRFSRANETLEDAIKSSWGVVVTKPLQLDIPYTSSEFGAITESNVLLSKTVASIGHDNVWYDITEAIADCKDFICRYDRVENGGNQVRVRVRYTNNTEDNYYIDIDSQARIQISETKTVSNINVVLTRDVVENVSSSWRFICYESGIKRIEEKTDEVEKETFSLNNASIIYNKSIRNVGTGSYWEQGVANIIDSEDFYAVLYDTSNVTATRPIRIQVSYTDNTSKSFDVYFRNPTHIKINEIKTVSAISIICYRSDSTLPSSIASTWKVLLYEVHEREYGTLNNDWINAVKNLQVNQGEKLCFGIQTDTHFGIKTSGTDVGNNLAEATKYVDFDFIANLGDIVRGFLTEDVDDDENTRSSMKELTDRYINGSKCPVLFCVGNHDANYPYDSEHETERLSNAELYSRLVKPVYNKSARVVGMRGKLYYYLETLPARIIVLDTGGYGDASSWQIDSDQLSWLENVALNTEKPVAVLCHVPLIESLAGSSPFDPSYTAAVEKLLAFKNSGGKVLGCFYGHVHAQNQAEVDGIKHMVFTYSQANENTAEFVMIDVDTGRIDTIGLGAASSRTMT